MKNIDVSDALIMAGAAIVFAGLYLVLWPLALVALGAIMTYVGLRRS